MINKERYINILIETIREYPAYYKNKIIKNLKDKELIFNDKRFKNEKKLLDVSNINNLNDKLEYIIKNLDTAIDEIEEFEYKRAYRYCCLFSISNYSDSKLESLESNGQVRKFKSNHEHISVNGIYPTYKVDSKRTMLKFNFILSRKDDENISIKYPVIAIIHKEMNILEIRLDTVEIAYRNSEMFYSNKIGDIKAWVISVLNSNMSEIKEEVSIEDIDFKSTVKYMSDKKAKEVTIVALKMRRNGMIAYLDSSANEERTIPILGELKRLLENNSELLEQNTKMKSLLYNFINKIERTSDLPAVKILWNKKQVKVSSTHDYKGQKYTLFRYYDDLRDEEIMNYVTEYLIKCKEENDRIFNNQCV